MIPVLNLIVVVLVILMSAYLARHYIFTLTALYHQKEQKNHNPHGTAYQPTVSILIPALNEEKVIGRILQRMSELTYPEEKLEVIVIDDASTDQTGGITEAFAREHAYMKVVHRSLEDGGKGKPAALNHGLKYAKGKSSFVSMLTITPKEIFLRSSSPASKIPRLEPYKEESLF